MEVEHGRHCNFQILEIYIIVPYNIHDALLFYHTSLFKEPRRQQVYNYKHDYTIIIGEVEAVTPVRLKAVFLLKIYLFLF